MFFFPLAGNILIIIIIIIADDDNRIGLIMIIEIFVLMVVKRS